MTSFENIDYALKSLGLQLSEDSRGIEKISYYLIDVDIPNETVYSWKADCSKGILYNCPPGESHEGPLRHYIKSRLEDPNCAGIIPLSKVVRAVLNELDMEPVLTGTLPGYQIWRRRELEREMQKV